MRNLSFRGYAQSKGFDPLKVPDETWKLQDETERTLRGMREVRSQNLQNRNEQLETLKSNARKEEQQRNVNQGLKQEFAKAYHDAEMQHYQTRVLDQNVKIREAQADYDRLKKLGELAPKAITAIAGFQNERFEAVMAKGKSLSLSLREQLGTEEYEAVLAEVKKGRALKEVMRQRHPSYKKTIDESLNGWELTAVQRHMARNHLLGSMGRTWATESNVKKPEGEQNLQQMQTNPETRDSTAGNLEIDRISESILSPFQNSGFSDSFINRELRKIVDEFVGTKRKAFHTLVGKNAADKVHETRGIEVIELFEDNPQDSINDIAALDNKAAGWGEFWHYNKNFAEKGGRYNLDYFTERYNRPVVIANENTTLARKYPNKVNDIYRAAIAKQKKDDLLHEALVDNNVKQELLNIQNSEESTGYPQHPALYKRAVQNITRGENVSMKDLERTKNGRSLIDGMNRPLEEYDQAKNDLFLIESLDEKGYLSIEKLMSPTVSLAQKKRFLPMTLEGKGLPSKWTNDLVKKTVKEQLEINSGKKTTSDIHTPLINLIMPHAEKNAYKYVLNYLDKNDSENYPDKTGLVTSALEQYATAMKDNPLYSSTGVGKNFKYTYFDTLAERISLNKVLEEVATDPSKLQDKDFLTDQQALPIIKYGKRGGEIPKILETLNKNIPNHDHIGIANMVLKAHGQKEIERKGLDNIFTTINPEYRSLVSNLPSMSKMFRAYNLTVDKLETPSEEYKAIYESLISKDIGFKFNDSKYEVIRTPNGLKSSTEMGIQLETTTVTDAMNMLNTGMASSIGAFDIQRETLQRAIAKGLITETDTLTEGVQLALKRNDIHDLTGSFLIDGIDEPIVGGGQYYTLPFNYKQRKKAGRSKGVSRKQANERFNKNIKNLVKFVDTQMDAQLEEGRQLSLKQEFLFDKIKQSIQATKAKVESGELKPTSRGLRPTETTKVVEETKSNIFYGELAKRGFKPFEFTDYMRVELEEE